MKRDNDGNIIGEKLNNPSSDSFFVEIPNGDQHNLAYIVITEFMYSQINSVGQK